MKRVLLTGMSGTGKSSVIQALAARGYKAVDTDNGWCEPLPDGRQRWREDAIEQLLATDDADVLFVAGCEENQVRFHPRFDVIILLSAPAEVLAERLASRTGNPYGKAPGELRRVFADLRTVEPLLRTAADYEIRTTMPLGEVVTVVLRLIGGRRRGQDTCPPLPAVKAYYGWPQARPGRRGEPAQWPSRAFIRWPYGSLLGCAGAAQGAAGDCLHDQVEAAAGGGVGRVVGHLAAGLGGG